MKVWKQIGLGAVIVFAAIQPMTCERSNPPVRSDIRAAKEVKTVLTRACYDCHSNETIWPWYSHVAPAAWLVHRDVTEGRAALNFSNWEALPADEQSKLQRESGEEVDDGEMPPWFYAQLHPHAALSSADKHLIQAWAHSTEVPREQADHADRAEH